MGPNRQGGVRCPYKIKKLNNDSKEWPFDHMELDLQILLAHISDGVYFVDRDRRITYWNQSAERITGYSAQEVIGHRCHDNLLIHVDEEGHSLCKGSCPMVKAIEGRTLMNGRVFLHHKEGHRILVNVRVVPLSDRNGTIIGGAEFFSEITAKEALQNRIRELEQLALIDPLTQLPNRVHVQITLNAQFHEMKRLNTHFGVLFFDIDHFKNFNDTYGHDIGDKVLKTVANTLQPARRPFDLTGRWGGEEFVSIIRNVNIDQLGIIAERQRRLIQSSSIRHQEKRLNITVSIGATVANAKDTEDSLIKRADQLMYQSKHNGRNRVTLG